ncbi:hypothetical protein O6H91_18G051500 [Diphasiastrum complanatum]|nr:hypothetical protein O6H91_18G051500 [Diphasiastrum complanatum]
MEELYFDMDVSASGNRDSTTYSQILSTSSESPEFEFNMSSLPEEYESADQLFFKGQLLPLLLPSRLQMVQTLCSSAPCEGQRCGAQEEKISCASFDSVVSDFRSNKSKCSSDTPLDHVELHNSSCGSQSSSSFWDSCDKDSAESSCRDSNGSSQDSCFSSKDMDTRERYVKGLEEVLNSANGKTEKAQSSWLKFGFQWKLLFGSKKASKGKVYDKGKQKPTTDVSDAKPCISVQNTSLGSLSVSPLCADRYSKGRANHGTRHHTIPFSCYSRRIYRALASEKCSNEGAQKPGDSWQRYLKPLKHLREKASDPTGEQAWTEEDSISANTLDNYFVKESPYAKKPSCTSFLPASLRVPSFARRSSTPTSRINSSRSSPSHSGVLSPLDYATMVDIQNAIQGAIAHCKQSQAGTKLELSGEIH